MSYYLQCFRKSWIASKKLFRENSAPHKLSQRTGAQISLSLSFISSCFSLLGNSSQKIYWVSTKATFVRLLTKYFGLNLNNKEEIQVSVSTLRCAFPCRHGLVSFTFWRHWVLESCCSFANTVFCIVIQNAKRECWYFGFVQRRLIEFN